MAMPMTTITVRISREFIEDENITETRGIVHVKIHFGASIFAAAQNVGKYGVSNCAITVNLFVKIRTPTIIINAPETTSIVW